MSLHHSTAEISGIVLTVRPDVMVSVREFGGAPVYVLEDAVNSRFYRIGPAEYTFYSLLDGRATFADALGRTASVLPEDALSESEAATFCRWLVQNQLAFTADSASSGRLLEAQDDVRRRKRAAWLNPMFIRVPLLNPDVFLNNASSLLGWLFSGPMFVVWLCVVAAGLLNVAMHWSDAVGSSSMVIDRSNWLWLMLTWLVLKLVHETAHGIVCRRYGGNVRETGVLLLLFVPLPYVDVSAAWRFDSKWRRMFVSAAGMYAELFVAAVAAIVWAQSDPGLLRQHCFNIMLSGSLVSVLFNANPLMRFDGYYILTDWLELPNLASHGQQMLQQIGRRIFLGLRSVVPTWPEGRGSMVFMYGVLALVWRIFVCAGLILAADALYFGAGLILAAIAVLLWILLPLGKLLLFVARGSDTERPSRARFLLSTGSLAAVAFVVWSYVPWHSRIEAPAVVSYRNSHDIRSGASGFVHSVAVKTGQPVSAGDELLRIRNPELNVRVAELNGLLAESKQRSRQYFDQQLIAAWQAEQKNTAALHRQLDEALKQLEQLVVRAPHDGLILTEQPERLDETFVRQGTALLTIGSAEDKTIYALVAPDATQQFLNRVHETVTVCIHGRGTLRAPGQLQSPAPRASTEIELTELAASAGGPVAVRAAADNDENEPQQKLWFAEPQLKVEVLVATNSLRTLRPGRTGVVYFRTNQELVGGVISQSISRWLHEHHAALLERWY